MGRRGWRRQKEADQALSGVGVGLQPSGVHHGGVISETMRAESESGSGGWGFDGRSQATREDRQARGRGRAANGRQRQAAWLSEDN